MKGLGLVMMKLPYLVFPDVNLCAASRDDEMNIHQPTLIKALTFPVCVYMVWGCVWMWGIVDMGVPCKRACVLARGRL